ncbi:MAG: hypothetical protein UW18_C0014G0007 [Microgenomates group bacterium GW2011_GWF1_44_10]|nr:MAG: hypothetical protein UW18_C0014G0007 [Microgenomates group bacterium GW2011_GWF1_44_10]
MENILEGMKKELQQAESSVEQGKSAVYQAIGVVNYLKAKIAEIEKAEVTDDKAKDKAKEVKDG